MNETWNVMRAALRGVWGDLVTTALCNLLWAVLNLSIVAGPPATMALFYVANQAAHGEVVDVRDFLCALRRSFGLGWKWGAVNLAVACLLVGDIILTGRPGSSDRARLIQGGFVTALAAWLLLQLYSLPFLFEQERLDLGQAWRNGAAMMGRNLAFSISLGLLLVCVLFLGTLFFFVSLAVGGFLIALVGNYAVLNRLEAWRRQRPITQAQASPAARFSSAATRMPSVSFTRSSSAPPPTKKTSSDKMPRRLVPANCPTNPNTAGPRMPANLDDTS